LKKIEYARVRAAERIFEERGTHAFPPVWVIPAEWRVELVNLATEFDFPIKTADEIEERFRAFVARISQS